MAQNFDRVSPYLAPLQGIRDLDASTVLMGTYNAQMLDYFVLFRAFKGEKS